jgi:hypothetical protein
VATWQGALIRVDSIERFLEIVPRFRIVISEPAAPWMLIDAPPQLGRLGPPPFARELSKHLNTSVIAFFLQTTVSYERIEHWQNGELVRELEYYAEGGGWVAQRGTPQPWEADYFFSADEGTRESVPWPSNLDDEVSTDDIARYEEARANHAPGPIMDLLRGGSLTRLCSFYGVDSKRPVGYYRPPPNWRVAASLSAVIALLVGACILGAVSR